jgi:hypothetical protein
MLTVVALYVQNVTIQEFARMLLIASVEFVTATVLAVVSA